MRLSDRATTNAVANTATRGRRAAAALAAGVAVSVAAALSLSGVGGSAASGPVHVSVSVDTHRLRAPVPRAFLGLSFELSSLGQIAQYSDTGNLVALLRSLGPGVLRFGGVSADTRVAWTDAVTPRPAWASAVLEAGELRQLARLARKSGWQVLLTIGLAHFDPAAAAREAAAARAALGASLIGIELGNEPDAYSRHGLRAAPWTFAQYAAQVTVYRGAIEAAAPGIPLAGPDVSGSRIFESWGPSEAIQDRPATLTGHHYPLGCHDVPAPTIARLLSAPIRRLEDVSLHRYLSVARASGIPFRLDETNSVSCGGRAGISDSFASALWAVDFIARTMVAGAQGINLHGNVANCHGYSPLCAPTPEQLAAGALRAQPEWYALLLMKSLIGDRPARTVIASPKRANIDVAALLGPDGRLHLVIVDDDPLGASRVTISVHVAGGAGAASVLALTAPSPAARTRVELGGSTVGTEGSLHAPERLAHTSARGGVVALTMSPASAALVTVAPR